MTRVFTPHGATRAGATLTDAVVLLVVLVCIAGAGLPLVSKTSEDSRRVNCARNLRQIAMAAIMYANAEVRSGAFPRTYYDPATAATPAVYTGVKAASSFAPGGPPPGGPAANDVSAALYLVLKTQELTPAVFVCEGSDADPIDHKVDPIDQRSNFASRKTLAYAYNNPFPSAAAAGLGWKFNNSLGPDFVFAADMGPGGAGPTSVTRSSARKAMTAANSPNHDGDGQNVVYCDAHVEFRDTPFCGTPQQNNKSLLDNIYTIGTVTPSSGGTAVSGAPQARFDAVLLPTWTDGAQPPRRAVARSLGDALGGSAGGSAVLYVGIAVLLLVVGAGLYFFVLRKPAQAEPAPAMPTNPSPGRWAAPQAPQAPPAGPRRPPPLPQRRPPPRA